MNTNQKGANNPYYKHGGRKTRLYNIWTLMKQRILNPKNQAYKNYGGRGITVCDEWLEFIPFRDWSLSHGYKETLEINRINNNGNYEPNNCRCIPKIENLRNTRHCKITMEIANEIRYLYSTGNYTYKILGGKYGINFSNIGHIILNKIWKNNGS